jgi:hypothetical protein
MDSLEEESGEGDEEEIWGEGISLVYVPCCEKSKRVDVHIIGVPNTTRKGDRINIAQWIS